jgi:hypothetical protein
MSLSDRQIANMETALLALGQRRNVIAEVTAKLVQRQATQRDKREAIRLVYVALYQLATKFQLVTGQASWPTVEGVTETQFQELEKATREFARAGNSIAKAAVIDLDRTPDHKATILSGLHTKVFQILVVLQMAMDSKVQPADLLARLPPQVD